MNDVTSLTLLRELIDQPRSSRRSELLRDPSGACDGWAFHVPSQFNAALDIAIPSGVKSSGESAASWTQGSRFGFKPGDTIYDTPRAYADWRTALRAMRFCLQVQSAEEAVPISSEAPRFPGRVRFNVYQPNKAKTELVNLEAHTVTQDEFVAILIAGFA